MTMMTPSPVKEDRKNHLEFMTLSSLRNNKGGFLVLGAIFVVLLFGFAALGIEAGRWFAVKAEIAKSVDAASLAGATHLTNPNIPNKVLFMQQMASANFPNGLLGTDQNTTFTVNNDPVTNKVTITGHANVLNTVSRALTYAGDSVVVEALGAARLGGAEVLLVTDVSGSMNEPSGAPAIDDLKNAAHQFIDNFEDTQDRTKFGLVSFASGAVVDYALQTNFHLDLTNAINGLTAFGGTNTSEALKKARTDAGYTSYTTEPMNERDGQYVILISDGQPTAFSSQFTRDGSDFSAVIQANVSNYVYKELCNPNAIHAIYPSGPIDPIPRGDGLPVGSSSCPGTDPVDDATTKWWILGDATYGPASTHNYYPPLAGQNPEACKDEADRAPSQAGGYILQTAEQMAIDEAALIKAQNIKIYVIGFGTINQSFLDQVSSGPDYRFYASSSSELEGLLQIIANRLKLRLLQ